MAALELVVLLTGALLVCSVLARRGRIAPPVVQLLLGVVLGFAPSLRRIELPPEAVLLLFLPALLWWESLTTSLREIRREVRGVLLMGTVLVVLTAAAVAAFAHLLGMSWGPAWVLGAALAPTDATAVGVLARSLPRRDVTLLQAESLVNDGTALVVHGLAIGLVTGEETARATHVAGLFTVSYVGGVVAGVVVGVLGVLVRRRLQGARDEIAVMVLVAFGAYLAAELVGASGVLAVVTAGLLTSRFGPHVGQAETRQDGQAFWSFTTWALNGALFVLVGLQAQSAFRGLTGSDIGRACLLTAGVALVLVVVRVLFLFTVAAWVRRLVTVVRRRAPRRAPVGVRGKVVSGVSGFRGAVSLAAALAVPETVGSGSGFPDRDLIVFTTAGVVVLTLVVQGLLLPRVIRWADLPADVGVAAERTGAEREAVGRALDALPGLATARGVQRTVADRLREEYQERLAVLEARRADRADDGGLAARAQEYAELRLALLEHERSTVLGMRDAGRIDDTVLRGLQARLDREQVRLTAPRTE